MGIPITSAASGNWQPAGLTWLIHPDDLAGLEVTFREALRARSRGPLLHYLTPHPGDTVAIHDGDVLPVLGGLTVIATAHYRPWTAAG